MPDLPSKGVLLRVLYLALDPSVLVGMDDRRSNIKPVRIDAVMAGESVAEVIASDDPAFRVGEVVLASTGWRTHVASDGTGVRKVDPAFAPITTALGVLGTPGFAAYSGITLIGKPKSGETVVVASASGAVGSLAGQLAKMAGARVIGIANGPESCRHVEEDLGFDVAIDGRAPGFAAMLTRACAEGIDVYFDNIGGGPRWHAVPPLLNRFARIPVWRLVALDGGAVEHLPRSMNALREAPDEDLTVRAFKNEKFADPRYVEFLRTITEQVAAGRVRYREDITDGLENAPRAFIEMLEGRKLGHALVRVAS